MLLPHEFWMPHGNPPWRGGVERALMSTSADKAVSLHYANGRGTVVEIDVGRIQTGGDVSFVSMVRLRPAHPSLPPPRPRPAPAPPPVVLCPSGSALFRPIHNFGRVQHRLPSPQLNNSITARGLLCVGCGQYPGEKEITLPPFTCLESHGAPRLEQTKEGELIIFPLKVNPRTLPYHPGFITTLLQYRQHSYILKILHH